MHAKFLKKEKIPSKLDGQISIFVFKSGKGTITGSKNTEELLESYMAIVNVLRTYQDELFIKDFLIEDLSTSSEQILFLINKFGWIYLKLTDSYLMNSWK